MPVLYANHSWSDRALTEVHVREFRVGHGLRSLFLAIRAKRNESGSLPALFLALARYKAVVGLRFEGQPGMSGPYLAFMGEECEATHFHCPPVFT